MRLGPRGNAWEVQKERVSLVRERLAPDPVLIPAMPQEVELDLAVAALVIIDMQRDFCAREGWLARQGVDVEPLAALADRIAGLAGVLRERGVPIVWVNWGVRGDLANIPAGVLHVYNPDGEGVGLGDALAEGVRVLQTPSGRGALIPGVGAREGDIYVDKHRMSGFFDTPLDGILRNLGVRTLLFGGVNQDQCVYATLVDAACLGYDVILLDDLAATSSPQFCAEATRYNVAQCYGFVAMAAALRRALEGEEPA